MCKKSDKHTQDIDLDDILPKIGEFGRYQKLMLWLVCLPACFPCGFCAFNQLFMTDTPPHWCWIPELHNLTIDQRKLLSIPNENGSKFSKCTQYDLNWTEVLKNEGLTKTEETKKTIHCQNGWEFDMSEIQSTIVKDFELVCNKDIYPTLGLVALNFGGPIGVYVFGMLNDSIGRKKSFFTCLTTLISGSLLTGFSENFFMWIFSRFIVGLTIPAIYQIPFIISLELVGPSYRAFVTVLTCMFYTIGLCMLAVVAYLIRDWRHLTLATSVPFILYYFYWFVLPESPRWLLAKGRFDEALKILEDLAKTNGKELPPSVIQSLKRSRSKSEKDELMKSPGLRGLCGTPNMRLKTFLITLNWFANEMVYVGLSYYGPSLGSDEYFSFLLSSAVEIPSYLMCWLIMDKWGRRWPLCLCMVISGVSCIATVLLPQDAVITTLVLFLISKSAISASFLIIYPFAGELYPTQLRGIGIGFSAYVGGLGLIIIPFITYLGSEMLILPLIIMGSISVIGGISGLRLPETLHHRLPQTVEEGEEFGKDFSTEDCLRCIPIRPDVSRVASYENLELQQLEPQEDTPLDLPRQRRVSSIRKLVKQQSIMDTPKDEHGNMKITYWV
ncbi:carcinine transporter isoform X2 [Harmonia axyridis]|uniref:carcinine transporter isoform X2 n=1 Tax=Harmonia axyridis TaxID=115357 RepID=UPI001E2758B4|nr:carcinine transporter isoform X2 [Harmonia axyridis]